MTGGWICLHRKIREHWIFKDSEKLKWWIDILLEVNHECKKVNIGNNLFECNRGQSINSILTWAIRWNVSKDTARNFLKLLQKDNMILLENLSKSTRITICNYDSYQVGLHDDQTQTKRKPNANQTQTDPNNNDNNDNNVNNDNNNPPLIPPEGDNPKTSKQKKSIEERENDFYSEIAKFKDDYSRDMLRAFFDYWSEKNPGGAKMRFEMQKTFETGKRLATWKRNNSKFENNAKQNSNNEREQRRAEVEQLHNDSKARLEAYLSSKHNPGN